MEQLPRPIARISFQGIPPEAQAQLLAGMPVHEGDILTEDTLRAAVQAARALNEGFEVSVSDAFNRDVYDKLPPHIQEKVKPPACDNGVNVTISNPAALPQRIRVDEATQESMLVERVAPTSWQSAIVELKVVVAKDGSVLEASPLTGPQSLSGLAIDAVRQWKYRPMLLNGRPVEVQTTVTLSFPSP